MPEDTDGMQDVYQRQGGTTTLISTGPLNANAPFPASFKGMSQTGTRVFFDTATNLVPHATGIYPDIYEREGDVTTFLSSGPVGGNGDFFAFFGVRRATARVSSSRPTSGSSQATPTRRRTSTHRP